jgi:biotin operon repressor
MNRVERISAILIHLQSKQIVRGQDIAERFGISLRTAYRDIRALEEAGVPIVGEAGTGYSLMEGYKLPPVMFTKEEAIINDNFLNSLIGGKIINTENYKKNEIFVKTDSINLNKYNKFIKNYISQRNDNKTNYQIILDLVKRYGK